MGQRKGKPRAQRGKGRTKRRWGHNYHGHCKYCGKSRTKGQKPTPSCTESVQESLGDAFAAAMMFNGE